MTQLKLRTRILSTIAAVALVPASALAQSPESDTSYGATDQPSQTGSQTGSQSQNGNQPVPSPSPSAAPAPTGSTSASPSAQTSVSPSGQPSQKQPSIGMNRSTHIDPAEVQKVFGSDVGLIDLASLSPEQVRALQQTLADRGFYQGEIDGVIGAQTRSAVSTMLAQQFALTQRLINQNKITESLASSIGLSTTELAPVRGVDPAQPMMQPQGQSAPQQGTQQRGTQGTQQRSNPSGSSSGNMNSGTNAGSATPSNPDYGSNPNPSPNGTGTSNSGSSNAGSSGGR